MVACRLPLNNIALYNPSVATWGIHHMHDAVQPYNHVQRAGGLEEGREAERETERTIDDNGCEPAEVADVRMGAESDWIHRVCTQQVVLRPCNHVAATAAQQTSMGNLKLFSQIGRHLMFSSA